MLCTTAINTSDRSNSAFVCWLQFKNKLIVLFITIFGTLPFPMLLRPCTRRALVGQLRGWWVTWRVTWRPRAAARPACAARRSVGRRRRSRGTRTACASSSTTTTRRRWRRRRTSAWSTRRRRHTSWRCGSWCPPTADGIGARRSTDTATPASPTACTSSVSHARRLHTTDHHHFFAQWYSSMEYAHLHRYNFRRAGQQGPTRTLTAALKRVIKRLLGTHSITQVKYYKREN